jgi:RNA polymerase sigma-70 factor (sigma-E family)
VTGDGADGEGDFDAFVTARYSTLVALARYLLRDPHRGEDVVQEVLGRVYARWSRIHRLEAPDAYVRRMVVRECLSWRRRRSSAELPDDDVPALPVADGTDARADRDAMLGLLARLSDRQRAVLVLRHYEDLSDHQIAELLGIREATVRGHAMTGLDRLRALVVADAGTDAADAAGHFRGRAL